MDRSVLRRALPSGHVFIGSDDNYLHAVNLNTGRLAWRFETAGVQLLYDVYHMQIMEGDVIRTIGENAASIAHFHTGGVPGRHEIDDRQELHYPAICKAIVATGYTGYLAQEFVPTDEPLKSLEAAFRICDV